MLPRLGLYLIKQPDKRQIMKRHTRLFLSIATLTFSLSAAAQKSPNSNVEYFRPADLGKTPSHVPGSPHGHVRQPLAYGKGYRYGHSVSGPMGNITIYSASPNRIHGTNLRPRSNHGLRPRSTTATGYKLQYKPAYGKTGRSGYGQ